MPRSRRLRWALVAFGALVIVLVAGGIGLYVAERYQGRDVVGSSTEEFVVTDIPDPVPPRPAPLDETVSWPTYGYSPERTRISPFRHRPPFERRWTFRGRNLLEFPPSIAYGNLYVSNIDGITWAVSTETGKAVWRHASGHCTASTPAVADELVVQAFLNPKPCNSSRSPFELEGAVIAFDARTGKVRWTVSLGPSESSPLIVGRRVLVGDWRGDVVALDLRTGRRLWAYRTGGRVKGAITASGDTAFAGSYDGHVVALDLRTGALRWRSASQGRLGGLGRF